VEVALTILYALIFVFLIRKLPFFRLPGIAPNAISLVFFLKVVAGLALYFIYTYYYTDRSTADIFKYFDDSKVMYDALFTNPADFLCMITGIGNDRPHFAGYYNQMQFWYRVYESNIYNDSHTIIRFNALIRIFSFGYYNVHTVFMCFFSFAGLTGIYRFLAPYAYERRKAVFFAVFLIPSVLFWGSGVLKEGLLLFGLGMLLWHLELLIQKRRILISIAFIAGSAILLLYTKFYIMMILFPLVAGHVWCSLTRQKWSFLKYALVTGLAVMLGLNLHHVFPDYNLLAILVQKQHDFLNLSQSVGSGSIVAMEPLQHDLWTVLRNIPQAMYISMFRPWFFESGSPYLVFAGFENLLLLILLAASLFFLKKKPYAYSVLWLCVFFTAGVFILTGLTTPVMGAVVRYKAPALVFYVMIFILVTDKTKIEAFIRRTRRFFVS
jgi:hypothetical protein